MHVVSWTFYGCMLSEAAQKTMVRAVAGNHKFLPSWRLSTTEKGPGNT